MGRGKKAGKQASKGGKGAPANPYPAPRAALSERPGYPFADKVPPPPDTSQKKPKLTRPRLASKRFRKGNTRRR